MDTGQRNNVMAGSFLLAAIALGLFMSFKLGDYQFQRTSEYTVRFTLVDGATGLAPGSVVKIGGFEVGEVAEVDLFPKQGKPERVDVTISIASKYELYDNAVVNLEKPLLGSLSSINIPDVGRPGTADPSQQTEAAAPAKAEGVLLQDGGMLIGTIAKPAVIADSGMGALLEKAEGILDHITTVLDEVESDDVRVMVEDAKATVADARKFVGEFSGKGERWAGNIDTTMDNVVGFTERLDPLMTNFDDGVSEGRQAIGQAQSILRDAQPKVSDSLENVREATERFKSETLPELDSAITQGKDLMTDMRTLLRQQKPNIERTLANARIFSDQLKLTMMEIRAQPWRAMIRPDTKELETQLLYDSARSFAVAASDLRAASELLDAAAAEPGGMIDPESLSRYQQELSDSITKFREAESQLLERILRTK